MADIGEVGSTVADVFGPQADELMAQLQTAGETAAAMQSRFTVATEASANQLVSELHVRLYDIIQGIGAITAAVAATQEPKSQLLDAWGITASRSRTAFSIGHTVANLETPHTKPLEYRLATDLRSLERFASDSTGTARAALTAMERQDLRTPRDALLMGATGLAAVRDMGGKRLGWVRTALSKHTPEIPLPDKPDPALAARLCDSLRDVPLSILDPGRNFIGYHNILDDRKLASDPAHVPVSIHDILQDPLFDNALKAGRLHNRNTELARARYEELKQRAQDYADKFSEAKRAQA
jgi:hypothetical protein